MTEKKIKGMVTAGASAAGKVTAAGSVRGAVTLPGRAAGECRIPLADYETLWENDPLLKKGEPVLAYGAAVFSVAGGISRSTANKPFLFVGDGTHTFRELQSLTDFDRRCLLEVERTVAPFYADPANRNGVYGGRNLSYLLTEDGELSGELLYSAAADGSFRVYDEIRRELVNLCLGDYFRITTETALPSGETVQEETELMIAGFDYYLGTGDISLEEHHILLIPRGAGFKTTAAMNLTDTTAGGYGASYMHGSVLPCYSESLAAPLGYHILTHRALYSDGSTRTWQDTGLSLMTEAQVYGAEVFTSSPLDIGLDSRQLPVFRFIDPVRFSRNGFWLRSAASATDYAFCSREGAAGSYKASQPMYVRPLIVFG